MSDATTILTGPHEEPQPQKEQKDHEGEELKEALGVAEDIVQWTQTQAGRDTIDRLSREAHGAMQELFQALHESPELGKMLSVAARFEAAMQMLRRFKGAKDDAQALLSILEERERMKEK